MYINTAQYDATNPPGQMTTVKAPSTTTTVQSPKTGPQADAFNKMGAAGYNDLTSGLGDLEAGNYKASGYSDIYSDPNLGMVPQATMDSYWNPAIAQATKKATGNYASIYGENGMAPSGVGSQVQSLTDMNRKMETTRAGAYMDNAAKGAATQAAAKQTISGNRYKVLQDPVNAYYQLQMGAGTGYNGQVSTTTGGGQTTTYPLGSGTASRTATGTNAGTSDVGAAQRPVVAGYAGSGGAPAASPAAANVQQPDYWGRSPSDPNYGQYAQTNPYGEYNPNDRPGQNAGVSVDTSSPYSSVLQPPMDNRTPDTYAW